MHRDGEINMQMPSQMFAGFEIWKRSIQWDMNRFFFLVKWKILFLSYVNSIWNSTRFFYTIFFSFPRRHCICNIKNPKKWKQKIKSTLSRIPIRITNANILIKHNKWFWNKFGSLVYLPISEWMVYPIGCFHCCSNERWTRCLFFFSSA